MKISQLTPGQSLYDVRSHRMGHTALRTVAVWVVRVIEVHDGYFIASWNGNRAQEYRLVPPSWKAKKPYLAKSVTWDKVRKCTREEIKTGEFVETANAFYLRKDSAE